MLSAALLSITVAGCGPPTLCTLIGGDSGVGIAVDPGHLADAARRVEVEFRQAGSTFGTARERLSKVPAPDGRALAFVVIPSLEDERLDMTVVLRDAEGQELLRQATSTTPTVDYPNGKGCDPRSVTTGVRISSDGVLNTPEQTFSTGRT